MSSPIKYRSQAAAEHAAKVLGRSLPHARIEVTPERSLIVWAYPETLTPAQSAQVEPHDLRRPAAPDPRSPLLQPRKRRPHSQWTPSKVKNAAALCLEVFADYHKRGQIDDRANAIKELIAAGVNPNTAKTYYVRYRESVGLPKSVRSQRRAIATAHKTVALSPRRPALGRTVANGITEPLDGSIQREVWDAADVMYRKLGRSPTQAETRARLPELSVDTVHPYLQNWRRFHAIKTKG